MPVVVTCAVCDRLTSVPPSRAATYRTCSRECYAVLRGGATMASCAQCGRTRTVRSSRADRPYCSLACYAEALKRPGRGTPTYSTWRSMKKRCLNPGHRSWPHYGGRGITICDAWLESFDAFLADMGERPDGTTLDRINPDGNYEPGNCRWATVLEQRHNRRPTIESTLSRRRST